MWEIAWAEVGTKELLDYLKDGWEPFAVSPYYPPDIEKVKNPNIIHNQNLMTIWLKKFIP